MASQSSPGSLIVGRVALVQDGLVFRCVPDKAQLERVREFLLSVENCSAWWWGDYLCKLIENHSTQETLNERNAGRADTLPLLSVPRFISSHLKAFAESNGLSEETTRIRRTVAAFYPIDQRVTGAHWELHAEAMRSRTLGEARALLVRARNEKMTLIQFRACIRESRAYPDGRPPTDDGWGVQLANTVAVTSRLVASLGNLSTAEARLMLKKLTPLAALVDHLRNRAQPIAV